MRGRFSALDHYVVPYGRDNYRIYGVHRGGVFVVYGISDHEPETALERLHGGLLSAVQTPQWRNADGVTVEVRNYDGTDYYIAIDAYGHMIVGDNAERGPSRGKFRTLEDLGRVVDISTMEEVVEAYDGSYDHHSRRDRPAGKSGSVGVPGWPDRGSGRRAGRGDSTVVDGPPRGGERSGGGFAAVAERRTYTVYVTGHARRHYMAVPQPDRRAINAAIRGLWYFRGNIKSLSGSAGLYRLRVGRWRVIFSRDGTHIEVVAIRLRNDRTYVARQGSTASTEVTALSLEAVISVAEHTTQSSRIGALSSDLYWRAHPKTRPFSVQDAHSTPINNDFMGYPREDGYSCLTNPWHVWSYCAVMGWLGDRLVQDHDVIGFTGKQIGTGHDREPLVVPDMATVKRTRLRLLRRAFWEYG